MSSKHKSSFKKYIGRAIVQTAALIFILVIFAPSVILPLFVRPLMRSDHPNRNAAAVIVLGGDAVFRVKAATRAVLDGYAPKLMMVESQTNDLEEEGLLPKESEIAIKIATHIGLGRDNIQILTMNGRATSTADEARTYRDYFAVHPIEPKRVIVVTSWPHSSRGGWILDKALDPLGIKVEMMPVDKIPYSFDEWWQSEPGMIFVFEEYVKWARYLAKYAARNLPE